MTLRDRETAERLREDHAGRPGGQRHLATGGSSERADDRAGAVTKASTRSVADTVDRLVELCQAKGLKVFAVIDRQPRPPGRPRPP